MISRLYRALLLVGVAATLQAQPMPRRGVIRTDSIWSQALGITKRLVVYLPPSYADTVVPRRYPVAVYLHGAWGSETDWTAQGHLAPTMDSLIASGRISVNVLPCPTADSTARPAPIFFASS